MSVTQFCRLLPESKYGKQDQKWFPLWLRRYAQEVGSHQGRLPVTADGVISFSRTLLNHGTPAWQRLQAVRAVEAYRDIVLHTAQPSLAEIRRGSAEKVAGVYCLRCMT